MSDHTTLARENEQDQTVSIPLTKGKHTIIDAADAALLPGKWHLSTKGYAVARRGGRIVSMHRIILGVKPGQFTDHANGDRLDNRRSNLRIATPGQNSANTKSHRDATSAFKGVYRPTGRNKWQARIMVAGVARHLGCFDDEQDAARCYDRAAFALQGVYAKLNFPKETRP